MPAPGGNASIDRRRRRAHHEIRAVAGAAVRRAIRVFETGESAPCLSDPSRRRSRTGRRSECHRFELVVVADRPRRTLPPRPICGRFDTSERRPTHPGLDNSGDNRCPRSDRRRCRVRHMPAAARQDQQPPSRERQRSRSPRADRWRR
jgi:hypothetical protein